MTVAGAQLPGQMQLRPQPATPDLDTQGRLRLALLGDSSSSRTTSFDYQAWTSFDYHAILFDTLLGKEDTCLRLHL